ncbi:hypothetical protein Tco_1031397 [Tanacetum coccineum]|uniref:Uncharacterized protein n=1 Tax=Tanacetum coccineum TaxID=301880 RepID=A0ABQ5G994_9ASTR
MSTPTQCCDMGSDSYERIDVVIGGELVVRHKGEMVCHEKVVKMPCVPKELVGFTPRRRIGFRMEFIQGATPICEGSCRLTSLERQEVWNDYKSCNVRVGSNGNLWWEASVLLGGVQVAREDDRGVTEGREVVRKVFQQHGSRAKRKLSRYGRNQIGQVPSGKGNVDVVPWSREGGRSEARMSSNVAWAWTNEYEKRKEMVQFLDKVREPLFGEDDGDALPKCIDNVWYCGSNIKMRFVGAANWKFILDIVVCRKPMILAQLYVDILSIISGELNGAKIKRSG